MPASVVQTAHALTTTSTNPLTATFAAGITAGSFIAVAAEWGSTSAATITDDKSDAITDSGAGAISDNNGLTSVIKAFFAATTGATAVTINVSPAAQFVHLVTWEIAGYSSPAFDQVNQVTGLNSNSITTSSTLAQASEVAIAYASTSNNSFTANSLNINHGTFTQDYDDTVGGADSNQAGHSITSATTALTASITISFNFMTIWIATFKDTGGGGDTLLGGTRLLMMRKALTGWRRRRSGLMIPAWSMRRAA